jgi:cell fate (sporulation/competence/biofilm development) regulator YlbF (YheA/YmcA/DUF963 family)
VVRVPLSDFFKTNTGKAMQPEAWLIFQPLRILWEGFFPLLEKITSGGVKVSKLEEALKKCIELGGILAQTEEYREFKKAEYNLMHDAEARKLVEDLQVLQREQLEKQMVGLELTKSEKNKLSEAERIAIQHPVIRASHMANTNFQELMKVISGKIREGLNKYSEESKLE